MFELKEEALGCAYGAHLSGTPATHRGRTKMNFNINTLTAMAAAALSEANVMDIDGPEPTMYRFIEDPGHGWLEVPRGELRVLGIDLRISQCSYEQGDFVYLEEDDDCTHYLRARFPKISDHDTQQHERWREFFNTRVTTVYQEDTFVRRLATYWPR